MATAADDPIWSPEYLGLSFLIWCKQAQGIYMPHKKVDSFVAVLLLSNIL
jgi:hypothetical protein